MMTLPSPPSGRSAVAVIAPPITTRAMVDIPSVHLSRALDTDVVPETTTDACYLIVTQNRHRPAGSKLQIAESRKAAGILMYYEVLRGDSIMFVGAMANRPKKTVHPKKFRKVRDSRGGGQAE